jgi:hypothetical protein
VTNQRRLLAIVVASLIVLAAGIGLQASGRAGALIPAREAASPGLTIPYQGWLTDQAEKPVADGAHDFSFGLYRAQTGGEPLWAEVQMDIPVVGGALHTTLGSVTPLPRELLDDQALWLAVGVRGPGEAGFTALVPRQRLSTAASNALSSPSNGMACPHDHWGEVWAEDGSSTSTGLELTGSGSTFRVRSTGGVAIQGTSTSILVPVVPGMWGVYGYGQDLGVYGKSTGGIGVQGESDSSNGVRGRSNTDNGVVGLSETGSGVYGESTHGVSVSGYSEHGQAVKGESVNNWAVHGTSTNGYGVIGTSSSIAGVYGYGSPGVEGQAAPGAQGVYGYGTIGVEGQGETGVYGNGSPGVHGHSYAGDAIKAEAEGSPGRALYATQTGSGDAVYVAQYGTGRAGFFGINNTSNSSYALEVTTNGTSLAAYFDGSVEVTGLLIKDSGGFKIDHPLDPENKYLYHSFVESPDMKNVYDGVVVLDEEGEEWVALPDWFEALNGSFRYQLTPIGAPAPGLYIAREIEDNRFLIAGGTPGLKVSWQVTGIRRDAFALAHPIPVEEDKPPEEQGTYKNPTEHGQPESAGRDYQRYQGLK